MMIQIFPLLVALSALLLVAQATPSASETNELPGEAYIETNELSDTIFIGNVETDPTVLSAQEALSPVQRNRVCIPAQCAQMCRRLGFRRSWCNANRVCVCRR